MIKVSDLVKSKTEYNEEEYLQEKVKYEKEQKGDLNLEDGYDCPICMNRGDLPEIKREPFVRIVSVPCECRKIRTSIKSLKYSGLSPDVINNAKFDNYKTTYEWQKTVKALVYDYIKNIDKKYWFYLGGQSGSGKTTIMTALFKHLIIEYHLTGKYMVWNSEIKALTSEMRRNSDIYIDRMHELRTCDLLYIDDLLKLSVNEQAEFSIFYDIINARYNNNKITIITSEKSIDKLENLNDEMAAIVGRINEKANNGKYVLALEGLEKNIRKNPMKK